MLALPTELRDALASAGGEPLRLTDPETQAEYVLVPADRYRPAEPPGPELLEYDDGPLTPEERRGLLIEFGRRAGWDDPVMDVYDDVLPEVAP